MKTPVGLNAILNSKNQEAIDFLNNYLENEQISYAPGAGQPQAYQIPKKYSTNTIDTIIDIDIQGKKMLRLIAFRPTGYILISTIKDIPNPPVLFFDGAKFNIKKPNPALTSYINVFLSTAAKDSKDLIDTTRKIAKPGQHKPPSGGYTPSGHAASHPTPTSQKRHKAYKDDPVYRVLTGFRTALSQKVSPQLKTAWHQSSPFNDKVPNRYPAGCVSIALGQIMAYHKHGGTRSYDWKALLRNTENDNTASKKEKADFIYDIGTWALTRYGKGGSTSDDYSAQICFKKMGYKRANLERHYSFDEVKRQLDRKDAEGHRHLVYLSGSVVKNTWACRDQKAYYWWCDDGGHAWVADGYKIVNTYARNAWYNEYGDYLYTTGELLYKTHRYVHMNWGWGNEGPQKGENGWATYSYTKSGRSGFTTGRRSHTYDYGLGMIIDLTH